MHLHFIGAGGIGMSGLAAAFKDLGHRITGSDRGAANPENSHIIQPLKNAGVEFFPQDGSYIVAGTPDALVFSTAIEEDNPDFVSGKGIKRLHRSALLAELIAQTGSTQLSIAVTGSCGKSTVTAYLAEALLNIGDDPRSLNGAVSKRFVSDTCVGNYRGGKGRFFVFEADESDKSLLNYSADYAVILNIGTDHYSKEELAEVFGKFLQNTRKGAVLDRSVYNEVKSFIPPHLEVAVFESDICPDAEYAVSEYALDKSSGAPVPRVKFSGSNDEHILPQSGFHMAKNALAIICTLEMLGFSRKDAEKAILRFDGIKRRSDFAGTSNAGFQVYDDYAHNPEKIASCLSNMQSLASGKVIAIFQPHGYGPFGFMRDELFSTLENVLNKNDIFCLLEPYYAGGTSSKKPSSTEVCSDWKEKSSTPDKYMVFPDRSSLRQFINDNGKKGDIVVIMGARDNSLSNYAQELAQL